MPAPPAPPGTTSGPSAFATTLVLTPPSAPTDIAGAGAASVAGASPQTAAHGLARLTGVSVFSNPPKSSSGGGGVHPPAPTPAPTATPPITPSRVATRAANSAGSPGPGSHISGFTSCRRIYCSRLNAYSEIYMPILNCSISKFRPDFWSLGLQMRVLRVEGRVLLRAFQA